MTVNLKNNLGNIKQCKIGFSWTFFFFGFWVPLFRGDFLGFITIFTLELLISLTPVFFLVFFINVFLCFQYNKMYIKRLLKKGYSPATDVDANILHQKNCL